MSEQRSSIGQRETAVPHVQRLTPVAARRHSRLVRHLRLAVPALGVGLLAAYVVTASPPRVDLAFSRSFSDNRYDTEAIQFQKPRYLGEDSEGAGFEVSAAVAEREAGQTRMITLEDPTASRDLNEAGTLNLTARRGLLDTEEQTIDLADEVTLVRRLGGAPFVISTEGATLDLEENTVTSTARARGEGEGGAVAADRVEVYQEERRLFLRGNVKLRLDAKDEDAAE